MGWTESALKCTSVATCQEGTKRKLACWGNCGRKKEKKRAVRRMAALGCELMAVINRVPALKWRLSLPAAK